MTIEPQRWERIQHLFHGALDLPESERASFLEAECADASLRAQVLEMLAEDARGESLLDRQLPELAQEVMGDLLPDGRTLGPYRILKVIGEGGMGVVCLAERSDLGNRVAIKMLRDAWVSPARRERFAIEQRVLAQLVHPSIAQLHDASTLPDGTPYFVMEYVEGLSLTEHCRARACSIAERLQLFRSVCEAVQFAHQHAIVHRDLKPSNVLVTSDGAVKLLDFGISKQLENIDAQADQTQTGLRLMTPSYAAPEQIRGEPVGIYTDVYALGVILYELLTGQLPFDLPKRTPGTAETMILRGEAERPSVLVKSTGAGASQERSIAWADLDVLCLTAMHKDAQRRYRTVDALIRDIDHYRKREPLEARPDTLSYRAGKFLRRNQRMVAASALVLAGVVGLVSFYTVRLAEQRTRAQTEAAKAGQVSEYLIGLFEAGDPFAPGIDSLDARTLLTRGVERAEALADQPDVQAQMLDVLGRVHTNLSDYERADTLLRRALALRRNLSDQSLDVAQTLGNLGNLYRYKGELDSAESYTREALAINQRFLPPGHADLATTLDNLGVILSNKGKYEEGERVYRQALDMRRELYTEPHALLNHSLNNLGVNLANQGEYAESERYLREALDVGKAVYGADHVGLAEDLANLGVVLEIQGSLEAADSALTEALRVTRDKLGDYHYETAFRMTQLGGALQRMGQQVRAEGILKRARTIEDSVLDRNHRNAAITRLGLAAVYMDRSDAAAAEPLLREAVDILLVSLGERHEFTATSRCHLANALHAQGELQEAERLSRLCLAVLEEALPADHDVLAGLRGKFGALLTTMQRFEEAETVLLDSHEKLRARFSPEDRNVAAAARRLVQLYEAWNRPEQAERYRQAVASAH